MKYIKNTIFVLCVLFLLVIPTISIAQTDNGSDIVDNNDNNDNLDSNDHNNNTNTNTNTDNESSPSNDGDSNSSSDDDNDDDWFNDDSLFDDIEEEDFLDEEGNTSSDSSSSEDEEKVDYVYDLLKIGGRFQVDLSVISGEADKNSETPLDNTMMIGTPLSASLYLNSRVNEIVRIYMELDLSFVPSYYDGLFSLKSVQESFEVSLDEMFLDINANYKMFFRIGKQNIKWGAGMRWSPTDFINNERKDPLHPDADRNGITGIKFTVPVSTANFIAFVGFENMKNILDTSITLRVEYAYKFFEISGTFYARRGKKLMYGLDYAFGAEFWGGTWDLTGEASFSMGSNQNFIVFDPSKPDITPPDPNEIGGKEELIQYILERARFGIEKNDKDPFFKVVTGLTYTTSKVPKWMGNIFMVNFEYYYNGEGYDFPDKDKEGNDINLIPYKILLGETYETGKHYIGLTVLSSSPDYCEDLSYNINYILNVSDLSSILLVGVSYFGVDMLSINTYVKASFGREGTEYYFASPITVASFFKNILNVIDIYGAQSIKYDKVLKEYITFGIKFGVNF